MKYSLIIFLILLNGCSNSSIFFEKVDVKYHTKKAEKYNYSNDRTKYKVIDIDTTESKYSTYKTNYNKKIEHDEGPKIYLKVN